MSTLFAIALIVALLGPVAAMLPGSAADHRAQLGATLSTLAAIMLAVVGGVAVIGREQIVVSLGDWFGFGHSALRIDPLSGIFLALTGVVGGAVALAHVELPAGRWLTALSGTMLVAIAATIGADNGFLFLLCWEGISICVYLIASAGGSEEQLRMGHLAGGLAKLGGASLLAAVGVLYAHTHSFEFSVWSTHHFGAGTRGLLFILLLTCFATKIGLLPLQGALPAGYGAAPRLGAASLSVALCAGFYGIWRFCFQILGPLPTWCGDALLVIGAATALAGVVYALTRDSLREFLGYSTVEHAGIAMVGFAVALLGAAAHNRTLAAAGLLAATLHLIAHNLAKTLALIAIDRVEVETGERTIGPLGGLASKLPGAGFGLAVASLTLAAMPPLGGFVSEWFTFQALLQSFELPALLSQVLCALAAAGLALTSGLGLLAFAKYFAFTFLGPARSSRSAPRKVPRFGVAPLGLGVAVLFLGAVAPWEIRALGSGLGRALGFNPAHAAISSPLILGPVVGNFAVLDPTILFGVLLGFGVIAWRIGARTGRRQVRREPVWLTGSAAETAATQYTPGAYSNPMRVILRGPLGFRSGLVAADPDGRAGSSGARAATGAGVKSPLGPPAMPGTPAIPGTPGQHRQSRFLLQRRFVLAVDRFVYQPIATLALAASAIVRRTQSGRLSSYLLYMLAALIVALALVPILH